MSTSGGDRSVSSHAEAGAATQRAAMSRPWARMLGFRIEGDHALTSVICWKLSIIALGSFRFRVNRVIFTNCIVTRRFGW